MAPERHRCGSESRHIMNIFFVFMLNRILEVKADLASPMLNLVMAFNAESER